MPEDHTECLVVLMALGRATMMLMDEVAQLRKAKSEVWIDDLESKMIAQVLQGPLEYRKAKEISVSLIKVFSGRLRGRRRWKAASLWCEW